MREIRFEKPAEKWDEALPIGNGRMGAMIFGQAGSASGECTERIQLNQDSIWYGGPQNRYNPAAKEYIEEIRKLILEKENVAGAEKLMRYTMSGIPQGERPYQTGGDLHITWECEKESEYYRTLDLEEGIVKVYAKVGENEIQKEYLASFPEQVMAVKVTASKPGSLNGAALLTREKFYKTVTPMGSNGIKLWGRCGDDGVHFATGVKAETVGGSVQVIGEHLIVRDADEVTFYIGMETSFYEPENWGEVLEKRLEGALEKGYETIRREHVEDYKNLYARVKLQIGSEEENDEELKYVMDYFQFGRYLCIAASRPGSLPANLQGIWNEFILPPWDSKYTININTEMNYWPVEGGNLSECHLPLFELLKRMWKRGQTVAREMYGCRGFVAHHNTDMWADCAPQDICNPATYWVMGAAWLCTHIWKHYLYTQDKAFLEEMYPVIRDAVLFFHDFLVEDHGELVTCPSISPENVFVLPSGMKGSADAGCTMDNEILRDLMGSYLKMSETLGISDEVTKTTEIIMAKLPGYKIGKHGQLQEWRKDYDEKEPGHRHISHLYALHPSSQITPDRTPELAQAAAKTLERRLEYGGGHTGWSCAWIVNMYARLFDGQNAWKNLQKMFEKSTAPNRMSTHPGGNGYLFQIDGNYGATSGIMEMILQSDEERTILLPAIPERWNDGSVKGLVMCSGALVDMEWKNGKVISCLIHGKNRFETAICVNGEKKQVTLESGKEYKII